MEDVDAILLDVVGHSPYTPDGPYLAPDAFGWKMQGELLQRGYLFEIGHAMRLRGIQMVRIAGELLRQYSNHESAVVAQSCAVLRRSLCIESYVHHFVFSLIIGTKVY